MKKLFLLCIFASFLSALSLAQIKPKLESDLNTALAVLHTKESIEEKSKELFLIFDEYFDYPLMARLALGSLYNSLSAEQKEEFNAVFVKRLKFSFSEKLGLYTNQKISITKDERPNEKRYFIHCEIKNENNETFNIIFKFHQASSDNFLLYDVDILGVSIISTYRAQFEDLKNVDFSVILDRLNNANALDKNP